MSGLVLCMGMAVFIATCYINKDKTLAMIGSLQVRKIDFMKTSAKAKV